MDFEAPPLPSPREHDETDDIVVDTGAPLMREEIAEGDGDRVPTPPIPTDVDAGVPVEPEVDAEAEVPEAAADLGEEDPRYEVATEHEPVLVNLAEVVSSAVPPAAEALAHHENQDGDATSAPGASDVVSPTAEEQQETLDTVAAAVLEQQEQQEEPEGDIAVASLDVRSEVDPQSVARGISETVRSMQSPDVLSGVSVGTNDGTSAAQDANGGDEEVEEEQQDASFEGASATLVVAAAPASAAPAANIEDFFAAPEHPLVAEFVAAPTPQFSSDAAAAVAVAPAPTASFEGSMSVEAPPPTPALESREPTMVAQRSRAQSQVAQNVGPATPGASFAAAGSRTELASASTGSFAALLPAAVVPPTPTAAPSAALPVEDEVDEAEGVTSPAGATTATVAAALDVAPAAPAAATTTFVGLTADEVREVVHSELGDAVAAVLGTVQEVGAAVVDVQTTAQATPDAVTAAITAQLERLGEQVAGYHAASMEQAMQSDSSTQLLRNVADGLAAVLQYQRQAASELDKGLTSLQDVRVFAEASRARMEELIATNARQDADLRAARCRLLPPADVMSPATPTGPKVRLLATIAGQQTLVPTTLQVLVGDFKKAALERAAAQGFVPPCADAGDAWRSWYVTIADGTTLYDGDSLEDVGVEAGATLRIVSQQPQPAPSAPAPAAPAAAATPGTATQSYGGYQFPIAAASPAAPVPPNAITAAAHAASGATTVSAAAAAPSSVLSSLPSSITSALDRGTMLMRAMVLDADRAASLSSTEGLERRLNGEMYRMEWEQLEAEERAARRVIRLRRVQTVRARLIDRATHGHTDTERRLAREAYQELNALTDALNAGSGSVTEVEAALLRSELALARRDAGSELVMLGGDPTTLLADGTPVEGAAPADATPAYGLAAALRQRELREEEERRVAGIMKAEEENAADRARLLVDIRDAMDVVQFRLRVADFHALETLLHRARTLINSRPLPTVPTLRGMMQELGAFIRDNATKI